MKSNLIKLNLILLSILIGIFILNKSCKEDNENTKYQIQNALKSKPKLSSVYPCDGEGSMVCESSQTCCNYNANCCSTRINLVRSNYSSSYAYAQALACELEKVLNGCTPQQVEYGCSVDKFCWAFNSATFGNINDYFGGTNTNPFAFCTHDTNTSPYTCGGIQYNVVTEHYGICDTHTI